MKKPRILFTASECTPIAKVGGLGDVIGALPKALRKQGIDARIIIPRYEHISRPSLSRVVRTTVRWGRISENITLYKTSLGRVPVYLIDNPTYLSRGPIYADRSAFVSSVNELSRFLFFSRSVAELLPKLGWKPSLIHCHDWHTAIIPTLLSLFSPEPSPRTLLTIHNLANQGSFPATRVLSFLGITKRRAQSLPSLAARDRYGNINLLQQGILTADRINTVSPTYAKEILTKAYGEGLERDLRKRKRDLNGILNGIDTDRFNPRTDRALAARFTAKTAAIKKTINKKSLQKELGIISSASVPLFGIVSRLTDQKGIELIIHAVPRLVKKGGQFVFLGQGARELEEGLKDLISQFPERVAGTIGFDAALAQRIYAGSDFFLMPSRFEPCGLGQMIAMRYGSIPIVRKVGGLADTVDPVPASPSRTAATGIVFNSYSHAAFAQAISRAFLLFGNSNHFQRIQTNALKKDFSWSSSAQQYATLYKHIIPV